MDYADLPVSNFEVIRNHGRYLVRRNTALVNEVLTIKRQKRELNIKMELDGYVGSVRPAV